MGSLITFLRDWIARLFSKRLPEGQTPEPIDYSLNDTDADSWEFCNQPAKEI